MQPLYLQCMPDNSTLYIILVFRYEHMKCSGEGRKSGIHNHTEKYSMANRLPAALVRQVQGRPRHTVSQCSTFAIFPVILNLLVANRDKLRQLHRIKYYTAHRNQHQV
jgi:hypothetical protein